MFKQHPTYLKYSANKDGIIIGARGRPLANFKHHTGYQVITVGNKQFRAHRFIWECWNGLIEDQQLVINHIDGNKGNNKISNLELVTTLENVAHATKNGLRGKIKSEKTWTAKLTVEEAKSLILQCKFSTKNNTTLGLEYNLHPRYISLIRHKHRWKELWDEVDKTYG